MREVEAAAYFVIRVLSHVLNVVFFETQKAEDRRDAKLNGGIIWIFIGILLWSRKMKGSTESRSHRAFFVVPTWIKPTRGVFSEKIFSMI